MPNADIDSEAPPLTRSTLPTRLGLWGGVVGPLGFVAAWAVGGVRTDAYSAIDDAISRLAAVDASTRTLMTIGFVCFGIGVPAFAVAARDVIGWRAAIAFVISGVMTLAVAASPLDHSDSIDMLHGVFATLGYVALAVAPVLAMRALRAHGHSRLAASAPWVSAVSAIALAATAFGPAHGLFQRVGLGATDLWLVATAITLLRAESVSSDRVALS